ncbi:hypothetical protein BDQ12DRAFT_718206 [Crucibulum laeve]|uniref:Uncharacterized protein n=1 Tax=Crucibulum laeve TaxID=68775 RepID=A0A5C3MI35_9AGAR|nr:hypothetical protein BDQ12DRAFT_718206 [Crucibulum laeve]
MAACPEPLERIFKKVEEESERRAREESFGSLTEVSELGEKAESSATNTRTRTRRRGSISISRIGQLQLTDEDYKSSQGPPTPKRVPSIASHSPFYQAQIANDSIASFASGASGLSNDNAHTEDDHHVTQMEQIAGRQSISKKVGSMLPRRLSRARSANVIAAGDANMVIGVSVQEATVETPEDEDEDERSGASVHAPGGLRYQASRMSMPGSVPPSKGSWVTRAKGFTQKFRRKGKQLSPTDPR